MEVFLYAVPNLAAFPKPAATRCVRTASKHVSPSGFSRAHARQKTLTRQAYSRQRLRLPKGHWGLSRKQRSARTLHKPLYPNAIPIGTPI